MNKRQIFIDTETTGLSPTTGHRIIELAAIEAINGQLTGKAFHTYLDPQRSIDPYAQNVHGITSIMLEGKPTFIDIADYFIDFIKDAECLMHNARFDESFINAELAKEGYILKLGDISKITCTLKLASQKFPSSNTSLDALIKHAKIPTIRKKHSALEDARLLAEIYLKLLAPIANTSNNAIKKISPSIKKIKKTDMNYTVMPDELGMEKTIELTAAQQNTFYYRKQHKRIIDHTVVNENRWRSINGPLLYAVTDYQGQIRYIGKWVTKSALRCRWLRHNTIHHQEHARNLYITELDAGRGPISVWSISIAELKKKLPASIQTMDESTIANGLEALWINRWKASLLWNERQEPLLADFHDGEYWQQ